MLGEPPWADPCAGAARIQLSPPGVPAEAASGDPAAAFSPGIPEPAAPAFRPAFISRIRGVLLDFRVLPQPLPRPLAHLSIHFVYEEEGSEREPPGRPPREDAGQEGERAASRTAPGRAPGPARPAGAIHLSPGGKHRRCQRKEPIDAPSRGHAMGRGGTEPPSQGRLPRRPPPPPRLPKGVRLPTEQGTGVCARTPGSSRPAPRAHRDRRR